VVDNSVGNRIGQPKAGPGGASLMDETSKAAETGA